MRIQATPGDFLDGERRFVKGQKYDVTDEEGYYFCKMGWAKNLDEETEPDEQPSEVNLDIHSSTIGLKDSNG